MPTGRVPVTASSVSAARSIRSRSVRGGRLGVDARGSSRAARSRAPRRRGRAVRRGAAAPTTAGTKKLALYAVPVEHFADARDAPARRRIRPRLSARERLAPSRSSFVSWSLSKDSATAQRAPPGHSAGCRLRPARTCPTVGRAMWLRPIRAARSCVSSIDGQDLAGDPAGPRPMARKVTASAISSGRPRRRMWMPSTICFCRSGPKASHWRSVEGFDRTKPGATEFTVIADAARVPAPAGGSARPARVSPRHRPGSRSGWAAAPRRRRWSRSAPQPRAFMPGAAACAHHIAASTFAAKIACQSSSAISSTGRPTWPRTPPAAVTRPSMRPCLASISAMAACAPARSPRSAAWVRGAPATRHARRHRCPSRRRSRRPQPAAATMAAPDALRGAGDGKDAALEAQLHSGTRRSTRSARLLAAALLDVVDQLDQPGQRRRGDAMLAPDLDHADRSAHPPRSCACARRGRARCRNGSWRSCGCARPSRPARRPSPPRSARQECVGIEAVEPQRAARPRRRQGASPRAPARGRRRGARAAPWRRTSTVGVSAVANSSAP